MAIVTSTSVGNANVPDTLASISNSIPSREASFSSYLNSNEETFVLKLAESIQNPSTTVITTQEPLYQVSSGRKTSAGEISVFGAEKYFNGIMDEEEETIVTREVEMKHYPKKDEKIIVHHMKQNIKPGTPSSCSEVSWNSRSALLVDIVRESSQNQQYKAISKSFFAALGCNCSCSDKKSVDIDENYKKNADCADSKIISKVPMDVKQTIFPSQSWVAGKSPGKSGDLFPFSTANSGLRNLKLEKQFQGEEQEMERKSLEVFGSPVLGKEDIALCLERRLNMLTWDANPRVPSIGCDLKIDENEDSDSSSDLFEIKSLSNMPYPILGRQVSDGMSDCPSTCYEPSEASIDWSVVTASAANFSVASDYDEQKSITVVRNPQVLNNPVKSMNNMFKATIEKEGPKRRAGMLSGCRNHKAVKIVAEAHKMSPKKNSEQGRPPRSGSVTPMSRFQAEAKVTEFESAHAQRSFATRSVTASKTLYMA